MTQQERFKHLVNFTIDELTTYLIKDFHLDTAEALDIVYSSKTLELLQNNGLDFMTKVQAMCIICSSMSIRLGNCHKSTNLY